MTTLRGLPGKLPAGERVLWRGAPDWRVLARRALHAQKLALYLGAVVAAVGASTASDGQGGREVALAVLRAAGFAAVPIAIALGYAWLAARYAVYTVTDRRLVLQIGIAVPLSINLPLARIAAASVNPYRDGSGDIAVVLTGRDKLAYLVLWPHARPWRLGRPQPALRGLKEVAPVAQVLARALAASAEMGAPVLQTETPAFAAAPRATMAA